MSTTETTQSRQYRLEIRNGRYGWRAHARGPQGIEWTSPVAHATRDLALEEGRDALRQAGFTVWDEWTDGVTDNHFDPRTISQLKVDAAKEAEAAGVDLGDPEALTEATRKLRELEAKRTEATRAARERTLSQPADIGMGVDSVTPPEQSATSESPLKQQRKRTGKIKESEEG